MSIGAITGIVVWIALVVLLYWQANRELLSWPFRTVVDHDYYERRTDGATDAVATGNPGYSHPVLLSRVDRGVF